jgi:hypothetical protein
MVIKNTSFIAVKSAAPVALMLTILISSPASAQKFYASIKTGIYSPQANQLDSGLNAEIAFGWRFHRNFAVEMGVGEFIVDGKDQFLGPAGITGKVDADISVTPIIFTLKGILPYKKCEFFGQGGGGAYLVYSEFRPRVSAAAVPLRVQSVDDMDDYDTVFGTHLGLGFHYYITPKVFVGAEGKYLWTQKVKMDDGSFGISSLSDFKLNGILATAVIGVKF